MANLPCPIPTESLTMRANDGVRLEDDELTASSTTTVKAKPTSIGPPVSKAAFSVFGFVAARSIDGATRCFQLLKPLGLESRSEGN